MGGFHPPKPIPPPSRRFSRGGIVQGVLTEMVPLTPVQVDHRAGVFQFEDTLSSFVDSLSEVEASALYELLNRCGCRFVGDAIAKWRKGTAP